MNPDPMKYQRCFRARMILSLYIVWRSHLQYTEEKKSLQLYLLAAYTGRVTVSLGNSNTHNIIYM